MPMSVEELYAEAQILPSEFKAVLVEKLVESIEDTIDPQVTKSHLDEVKRRRDEIRLGKVIPINGEEGLAQVGSMIKEGIINKNKNKYFIKGVNKVWQ